MKNDLIYIIPARGGSKRLPRKNLYNILGKPCIQYSLEACLKSKYFNNNIYVSSEDKEILSFANQMGANVIKRPDHLSLDHVWTQKVLEHASDHLKDKNFKYVVRVQANSPQVTCEKIDECIEKLIQHNLWEVFTVDECGIEDAAIHVLKRECVYQKGLSVYKGVVSTNYVDLHTIEDVSIIEKRMKNDTYTK
jgi:CMP-N,N'-diacetyllegionaminic acid synthase